ncbi:unnamed protein product [Closterium sp. NIES-54]
MGSNPIPDTPFVGLGARSLAPVSLPHPCPSSLVALHRKRQHSFLMFPQLQGVSACDGAYLIPTLSHSSSTPPSPTPQTLDVGHFIAVRAIQELRGAPLFVLPHPLSRPPPSPSPQSLDAGHFIAVRAIQELRERNRSHGGKRPLLVGIGGPSGSGKSRYDQCMAWHGMAWLAWHGMAWHDTAWHGWHSMARHGMVSMAWHGMAWHGTAWHGWHGMASITLLWHRGTLPEPWGKRPLLVGIGGPSGSGKLSLAHRIASMLEGTVIEQVNYMDAAMGTGDMHDVNALDMELLHRHMQGGPSRCLSLTLLTAAARGSASSRRHLAVWCVEDYFQTHRQKWSTRGSMLLSHCLTAPHHSPTAPRDSLIAPHHSLTAPLIVHQQSLPFEYPHSSELIEPTLTAPSDSSQGGMRTALAPAPPVGPWDCRGGGRALHAAAEGQV